ncbi:hypothetical protein K502DRAFT_292270 [Neoconidiobolus thromboides FSU 785]|nr:hypothetical protein K502DRAFT_292270 [Neoconidiobolus thromboides FSU 785]
MDIIKIKYYQSFNQKDRIYQFINVSFYILYSFRILIYFLAREQLLRLVQENAVTVLVSETGSGKSTQIPQYLYEESIVDKDHKVGISQPRRVACTTLAERVSQEVGCKLGGKVGYSVRFDDKTNFNTIIKYVTDGMLLREVQNDEYLLQYKIIILDEAHERTIRNDFLMGKLKQIVNYRRNILKQEFHLIIMSATLDSKKFSQFYDNAPIIRIPGRGNKVEILNVCNPQESYIESAAQTVMQLHFTNPLKQVANNDDKRNTKDILVFLPGQEEIETCQLILDKLIEESNNEEAKKLKIYQLYSSLPQEQQKLALQPIQDQNLRKCILATNIAETSLTISGIYYVIDTGLAKFRSFNSNTGIEALQLGAISKSGAIQRAGRAGREGPGCCIRLYTKELYNNLLSMDTPEIERCSLDSSILNLMATGIKNVISFNFIDPPNKLSMIKTLSNLSILGAINENCQLNETGELMAKFPLLPRFSKVLIESKNFKCTKEILMIISIMSTENIYFNPTNDKKEEAAETRKKFINYYSDHLTLLNIFKQFITQHNKIEFCNDHYLNYKSLNEALKIKDQLTEICKLNEIDPTISTSDSQIILKCLLTGFYDNIAILNKENKYTIFGSNQIIKIHPTSVMIGREKAKSIMYNELLLTKNHYLKQVSEIDIHWILDLAKNNCKKRKKE